MRKLTALVAVGAAMLMAGCATSLHTLSPAGASLSANYAGAVSVKKVYPDQNLTLDPPRASDMTAAAVAARITPEAAFGVCQKMATGCPTDVAATVVLARVSNPGSDYVGMDRLAYVLIWNRPTCVHAGTGVPGSGFPAPDPVVKNCLYITVIDATNGQALGLSIQGGVDPNSSLGALPQTTK